MKAIMISIKPKWCALIMNGEKTIEIRKKFPKDYVGWVYIYCTKANPYCMVGINNNKTFCDKGGEDSCYSPDHNYIGNGKVVARFYCDKVDDYVNGSKWSWKSGCPMWGACNDYEYILKDTCLTEDELYDYCEDLAFSAIHISDLEIFDKPKELSEFKPYTCNKCDFQLCSYCNIRPLTKAPQNWQYIKEELYDH